MKIELVAATVSLAIGIAPAYATDGEDRSSDEVIVIGQKLDRTLLETPSSVTVVTGDELDQPAYLDVDAYLRTIPNVTFDSGGNAPTVRGVFGGGVAAGADGAISGGRPRLTTYVDGVPRSFSFLPNGVPLTWDLDQLAFYRGAQSTTIGRNSIAGALVVATKDPVNAFEGAAQAGYRSREATWSGAGTINVPIIDDRLALRVTADGYDGAGFITYGGPALAPFDDVISRDEGYRLRAKLAWRPFGFDSDTQIRLAYERQEVRRPSPEDVADFGSDEPVLTNPFSVAIFNLDNEFLSLEARHAIDENWSVYAIASYQAALEDSPGIDPANPASFLDVFADAEEWTQEARVAWQSTSNRAAAAFGVFHFSRDRVEGGDPASAFPYAATDEASTFAVFADAVVPVGAFDILAGGRWERESQDRDFLSLAFGASLDFDRTQTIFLPKGGARWNIGSDRSLTALYYRGYSPAAAGFDLFFAPGPYTFERETSDTAELAFRSALLDGAVEVNTNIFYTRFDGQQINDPGTFRLTNAEATEYFGIEADAKWRPTGRLDLQASLGLLETKLVRFGTTDGDINNGNALGVAPAVTARASADWRPFDGLSLAGTFGYTGAYFSTISNESSGRVDARALIDLRAAYDFGRLTAFVYVENAADADYDTFRDAAFGTRNVGRPRTVGAAIRAIF